MRPIFNEFKRKVYAKRDRSSRFFIHTGGGGKYRFVDLQFQKARFNVTMIKLSSKCLGVTRSRAETRDNRIRFPARG